MVDFQSRDTRRAPTTDDETDTESEDDRPADDKEAADEQQPDGGASESADRGEHDAAAGESAADASPETSDERDPPAETDTTTTDDPLAEPTDQADAETGDEMAAEPGAGEPSQSVAVAVVTVGEVGEDLEERVATGFESAGHTVSVRERLRGDYDTVQQVVDRLVDSGDVDVVVTAGGVGIEAGEVTIEAVHPLLEKALPGFGEAFRSLLFEVIGTGIVAVRTAAGVANGTLVFCLPGDPEASAIAVEEILVTEAPELVAHLSE